jgi:hypothetical protein
MTKPCPTCGRVGSRNHAKVVRGTTPPEAAPILTATWNAVAEALTLAQPGGTYPRRQIIDAARALDPQVVQATCEALLTAAHSEGLIRVERRLGGDPKRVRAYVTVPAGWRWPR